MSFWQAINESLHVKKMHQSKPQYLLYGAFLIFITQLIWLSQIATCQTINAFSAADKTAIVNAHNTVRFDPTISPKPTNMVNIAWDDTVALAIRW